MADETSRGTRRPPGRRARHEGDAEGTRRDILWHALRLFEERGYAAVSVDEVAAAAGVTKATFYYHFRGKSGVFVESVEAMARETHDHVAVITGRSEWTVYRRLQVLLEERRRRLEAARSTETMREEAFRHLSPEELRRVFAAFDALSAPLRAMFVEGMERGEVRLADPDVLVAACSFLFQPGFHRHPSLAGKDTAEIDAVLLDLFWTGVRNNEGEVSS